ncbi:MAG: hypothetical protein WDN30_14960 [Pararobbsia sp.]
MNDALHFAPVAGGCGAHASLGERVGLALAWRGVAPLLVVQGRVVPRILPAFGFSPFFIFGSVAWLAFALHRCTPSSFAPFTRPFPDNVAFASGKRG